MDNYQEKLDEFITGMGALGTKIPKTMAGFGELNKAAMAEGALTTSVKELVALGIGIAIRCEVCIVVHVKGALGAGASADQIMETIGVAVAMGGGPAVVYGCQAMAVLKQFSPEK